MNQLFKAAKEVIETAGYDKIRGRATGDRIVAGPVFNRLQKAVELLNTQNNKPCTHPVACRLQGNVQICGLCGKQQ